MVEIFIYFVLKSKRIILYHNRIQRHYLELCRKLIFKWMICTNICTNENYQLYTAVLHLHEMVMRVAKKEAISSKSVIIKQYTVVLQPFFYSCSYQ